MAQYTVRESSQLAGSLYAAAVCFRVRVENNQRVPADMVLQLLRNIGPGRGVSQHGFTDTVYGSRCRIDTDRRFQAGFVYQVATGSGITAKIRVIKYDI